MLSLDSSEWGEVSHCYGPASDLPPLLRQLAEDPSRNEKSTDKVWESLWSALCHQGDVYQASYVAVPHLVAIASEAKGPIDFSFFLLPALIEVARANGRGPTVLSQYRDAYFAALRSIEDCVARLANEPWSKDLTISIAAALAAIKGHHRVAEAIGNLDDDWIDEIIDPS